jgi:hypothetical protein
MPLGNHAIARASIMPVAVLPQLVKIEGKNATPANLIHNLLTGTAGVFPHWDRGRLSSPGPRASRPQ